MKLTLVSLFLFLPISALAWDGTLRGSGDMIEIEDDQSVNEGDVIEYYDHDTVETHEAEIQSIDNSDFTTNVEVLDNDSGAEQVLEME